MNADDIIQSAVNAVVGPMLRLLQDDPHGWSDRPCATCRAIGALAGQEFGCYVYAERKRQIAAPRPPHGATTPALGFSADKGADTP